MSNLCKYCKEQGYSKEEYKNIENNINVLSDALVQEYFSKDAYYFWLLIMFLFLWICL